MGNPAPNADCNLLHVHLESQGVEIVGVRVPAYKRRPQKADYWTRFEDKIGPLANDRMVVVGDLNTHIDRKRCVGASGLRQLKHRGWSVITPASGWSYYPRKGKPTRIDHALLGKSLKLAQAAYVTERGGYLFAGPQDATAMSDHAVLCLDLDAASEHTRFEAPQN